MNYQVTKEYNTKIWFDVFLIRNTVNDIKITVCEKIWKSKYYILSLKEDESITRKCFLSRLRFIKKQNASTFVQWKI